MPPLLGGFNVGQVAGGEFTMPSFTGSAGSFVDAWRDALSAATSGGTVPSTEQDPIRIGGAEPPDFSQLQDSQYLQPQAIDRLQAQKMLRDFMAEHGGDWGGSGGGLWGENYFTSGAEYWTRQGAEAAEYISNIPGEVGEAGGELLAGLGAGAGAGLGGLVDPLTAIPGDLFKNIPIWVPVLGAAFLLTR